MRLEEFIKISNNAKTLDELFQSFENEMAHLGFDRVIFSLMTDHIALDQKAGHGIAKNYPDDWMKYYGEQGYVDTDPVRRTLFSSDGPFIWKDLLNVPNLTQTQVDCIELGAEAGLNDGIGIPLRGTHGALAGIGAASSGGGVELNQENLCYVNMLAQQFYLAYISHVKQQNNDTIETAFLSDREQDILKWCAQGKTKWEIGQILAISEHTVNFHVRNAQKKLEASNITVAVIKALHQGLIQL